MNSVFRKFTKLSNYHHKPVLKHSHLMPIRGQLLAILPQSAFCQIRTLGTFLLLLWAESAPFSCSWGSSSSRWLDNFLFWYQCLKQLILGPAFRAPLPFGTLLLFSLNSKHFRFFLWISSLGHRVNQKRKSFATCQYHSQWGLPEVRLLLYENFSQKWVVGFPNILRISPGFFLLISTFFCGKTAYFVLLQLSYVWHLSYGPHMICSKWACLLWLWVESGTQARSDWAGAGYFPNFLHPCFLSFY